MAEPQRLHRGRRSAFLICLVSFVGICAELLATSIIGMKSWSHMVYIVISFALLGYGIGSILFLVLRERVRALAAGDLQAALLLALALGLFLVGRTMPVLPLELTMLTTAKGGLLLALVCGMVALPFVAVGFLIVHVFDLQDERPGTLYFWDLLGAGAGAVAFYFLVGALGPSRSLALFAAVLSLCASWLLWGPARARVVAALGCLGLASLFSTTLSRPDPEYVVDKAVSWEWIPGCAGEGGYRTFLREWTPMGRTDLYEVTNRRLLSRLIVEGWGTFQVNLRPLPPCRYFVNSFRAGTPVYQYSPEGLAQRASEVRLFSRPMEFPYRLLDRPRVLVIGAGGGRDIFMAKTHGAPSVVGAEINPATWRAMMPGGVAHEYSGRLYSAPGVSVSNIDGRHLVKTRPPGEVDLVILNGVDTFAAISSGAYAYAENYLYTREAVVDYLRVLRPGGYLNFNRWFEEEPRETLRLFVMVLEALRVSGHPSPWKHVIVGSGDGWGMMLVKEQPFTAAEARAVLGDFAVHGTRLVFADARLRSDAGPLPGLAEFRSAGCAPPDLNAFQSYARALEEGRGDRFIRDYPADISVVHDDSPFFYKYYKFTLNPDLFFGMHGRNTTAFLVQFVILAIALVFVAVFIFGPLLLFQRGGLGSLAAGTRAPFVVYFSGLGLGFIFIEIPMMQKCTLLLGSPIYSISVTLASLLAFSALGSLLAARAARSADRLHPLVAAACAGVVLYLGLFIWGGTPMVGALVFLPLWARVLATAAMLLPLGVCLGACLPIGLTAAARQAPASLAWAWGINFGFTVVGSVLSTVIAQFARFNVVLLLAGGTYVAAALAFRAWEKRGAQAAAGA